VNPLTGANAIPVRNQRFNLNKPFNGDLCDLLSRRNPRLSPPSNFKFKSNGTWAQHLFHNRPLLLLPIRRLLWALTLLGWVSWVSSWPVKDLWPPSPPGCLPRHLPTSRTLLLISRTALSPLLVSIESIQLPSLLSR
jgi:hypothetical protein